MILTVRSFFQWLRKVYQRLKFCFQKLILNIQKYGELLKNLSQRFSKETLNFLLSQKESLESILDSEKEIQKLGAEFKTWFAKNALLGITEAKTSAIVDEELGGFSFSLETIQFGYKTESVFTKRFAQSTEWNELKTLWSNFNQLIPLPVQMKIDDEEKVFTDYNDFAQFTIEIGKKGIYVQRYKGLGEMNPEQLWETTLNPANRSLLRVTIDDAMAAEETFSILMGELVEPRRKFINDNALLAQNLDV